jgi:putative flippase GtrA
MKQFIKANVASLISSFCDFLITIVITEFFDYDPFWASVTGTVSGGIINFIIARYWVFEVHHLNIYHQGRRYFIIWTGNLLLNALGMYILLKLVGLNYILAKVITSVIVAVGYNYPLQKKYVFKNNQS